MNDELVSVADNRRLRAIVHDITSGCFLTKSEYDSIAQTINEAVDRICKEQGVFRDAT